MVGHLHQLFLGALEGTDVGKAADVVAQRAAGVADHVDGQPLGERLAVGAHVPELAAPLVALVQGSPDLPTGAAGAVVVAQFAGAPTDQVSAPVAHHLAIGRIDFDDAQLGRGDEHALAGGLEGAQVQAQAVLSLAARPDLLLQLGGTLAHPQIQPGELTLQRLGDAGQPQVGADTGQHFLHLERLTDEINGAGTEALDLVLGFVFDRQEHHRDVGGAVVAFQFTAHLEAAHARHAHVEQDQFGGTGQHLEQRLFAAAGLAHHVAGVAQQRGQQQQRLRGVVDHQDFALGRGRGHRGRTGLPVVVDMLVAHGRWL